MRYILIFLLLSIFLISGCATVIMPTIETPCPPDKDNNFIVSAIVLTLQDHNIPINVVSPEIGMVSTGLFATSSKLEEAVNVLLIGLTYKKAMKLTIMIDKSKNLIIMKPLKQQLQGFYGWQMINLDENDRAFLSKLSQEMASKMSIPVEGIKWIEPIPEKPIVENIIKKDDIKKITDDDIVYKNITGNRYHKKGCMYLRKDAISITLKEAKKEGLVPCRCIPF